MSPDGVISNWHRGAARIVCSLALLFTAQLALASQPCADGMMGEVSLSGAGASPLCAAPMAAMAAPARFCAAKAELGQALAVAHTVPDLFAFPGTQARATRMAATTSHAALPSAPRGSGSPPVHILLRRFLS